MQSAIRYITIGTVLKGKGVDRSIKVLPLTFDPGRFFFLKEVFFQNGDSLIRGEVLDVTVLPDHVMLSIKGFDSPDTILTLYGSEVKIPENESPALPEGTYYHYEIIGLDVYTEKGKYLGKVHDIIETGSNDVYAVMKDGKELLIPATEEIIMKIDLNEGVIFINPMRGLLDDL